jgi:hypothetical protein
MCLNRELKLLYFEYRIFCSDSGSLGSKWSHVWFITREVSASCYFIGLLLRGMKSRYLQHLNDSSSEEQQQQKNF